MVPIRPFSSPVRTQRERPQPLAAADPRPAALGQACGPMTTVDARRLWPVAQAMDGGGRAGVAMSDHQVLCRELLVTTAPPPAQHGARRRKQARRGEAEPWEHAEQGRRNPIADGIRAAVELCPVAAQRHPETAILVWSRVVLLPAPPPPASRYP